MKNHWGYFLENIFHPVCISVDRGKAICCNKKGFSTIASLRKKLKIHEMFKNRTSEARGNQRISLVHGKSMDFEGFRGHDFKVLAEIFDRHLILVLGVVSPTCTHSGRLLDIINSVFWCQEYIMSGFMKDFQ